MLLVFTLAISALCSLTSFQEASIVDIKSFKELQKEKKLAQVELRNTFNKYFERIRQLQQLDDLDNVIQVESNGIELMQTHLSHLRLAFFYYEKQALLVQELITGKAEYCEESWQKISDLEETLESQQKEIAQARADVVEEYKERAQKAAEKASLACKQYRDQSIKNRIDSNREGMCTLKALQEYLRLCLLAEQEFERVKFYDVERPRSVKRVRFLSSQLK